MKKYLMILAAIFCCTMTAVSFTACSDDDDDEETTTTYYTYGFTEVHSTSFSEMGTIENVFKSALGVSETPFTYSGGDAKVKAACETAAAKLDTMEITGTYTFVVNKHTGANVYTWSNID